jgi:DMSO reductase anchor subunit
MELQWPLMIFTLLICLGAGSFAVAGLLAALKKSPEVQLPAVIAALVFVVAGGIASFLHLQHWDRAFNGFGHISSGITQELIGIAVFVIVAVIYLVLLRKGELPAWIGWIALGVSVLLVIVMSNSYNMAARPLWNTPLLWLYYLANAVLFGSLAVALIAAVKKTDAKLALQLSLAGGALTLVATAAYALYIPSTASAFTSVGSYFDPTHPTKAMADPAAALSGFLSGDLALLFWVGVVIAGVLIPLLLAFLALKKSATPLLALAAISLVVAIAGAVCFRVIFYALGFSVFVFY